MKNLKKTLAVVLAFAMVLSMGFSAFAYTDVTAGTKVSEAVGILSNLGIFTGFEDGTFRPNDTVTRAQMAAIICRTLGYEDQAQASTGATVFNDVAASHWASGYINVAQSLQIVNGYGDGNFGPEDQVTYEQAIKMIVVALGYELDAQAKGGWSTGYLAVAAREGISRNSNGVVGAPAARGTIAVLVYNSLEVPLMDQSTWTPSGADDAYAKLQETVLSRYLDVTKIEAVVTDVPYKTFAISGYEADADENVTFSSVDAKAYGFKDDSKVYQAIAYNLDGYTFDASLVPEINNMAGRKVVAYVGNDEETSAPTVYAVAEKQGANKVTVISAAQLTDDGEDGVIEYKEVGSNSKKTLALENNGTSSSPDYAITPVVNFGDVTEGVEAIVDTAALKNVAGNGIITLISNDADSNIDLIFITQYTGEAVIEEVTKEEALISFESYTSYQLPEVDTEEEDLLYVVIKDGAVATIADIAANDTVSAVTFSDNETFYLYYVSSKTVTGKVDSYGRDSVEIAGADYELSPFAGYETPEGAASETAALSGKEGIFFLNVDGQIAHDEATTEKNFGVIYAAGKIGANKYAADVVLADGTTGSYNLKNKNLKVNGATTDAAAFVASLTMTAGTDIDWKEANASEIPALVYDITVKNGEITKLQIATADYSNVSNREYDAENMEYGELTFDEATVVISVKEDTVVREGETVPAPIEAADIKVGKVADFFVDDEGRDFHLWAFDENNQGISGLVVGTGLADAIAQDGAAFIFADYRTKIVDDEDAYVLNGFQDGKKVSYTILEDDAEGIEALVPGAVLLLGVANADGMISDLEVLFNNGALSEGIANKEDEYYYFGTVDETEITDSKFYFNDYVEAINAANVSVYEGEELVIEGKEYAVAGSVSMRNSANYTLVDFSDDVDEPTISKKAKGKTLFYNTNKYGYNAFVRYYEGTQVEVIVYKYLNADLPAVEGEVVEPEDPEGGEVVDPEDPEGGEVVDPEGGEEVDPEDPEGGEVVDPEGGEVVDPEDPEGGEVVDPEGGEEVDPEGGEEDLGGEEE